MKRNSKRLLLAAGLSLTCYAASTLWYRSTEQVRESYGDKKPIAYIERSKDEISRRPLTQTIWQLVSDGDAIYSGETVRTSALGEVRIQFAEGARYLEMEPDSLIVLSQSQNKEISLDLVDGSLVVHQADPAKEGAKEKATDGAKEETSGETAPGLSLKSGNRKLDLSKATASLSKNTNGKLDLQVLKGQVKFEENGKASEMTSGKSATFGGNGLTSNKASEDFQKIEPTSGQALSQNPHDLQKINFHWKTAAAQTAVLFYLGTQRNNLKLKAESTDGQVSFPLPAGVYYWQLSSKSQADEKKSTSSPIYKFEVVNRFPPVVIAPTADERILNTKTAVEFRWLRADLASSTRLQVSNLEDFKQLAVDESFEQAEHVQKTLPDGDYFFRVSSRFADSEKWLSSPVQKFHLAQTAEPKLTRILWRKENAVDPEKSEAFTDSDSEMIHQFYTVAPLVTLRWAPSSDGKSKTYKIRLASTEENLRVRPELKETSETQLEIPLAAAGIYLAQVEGWSEKNELVSQSPIQQIQVAQFPLLNPPQILPLEGALQATLQGRLDLQWNPVPGAKSYEVSLLDSQGKIVRSAKFDKTSTSLINLLPGDLQVQVLAIDVYGRAGEKAPSRMVRVPASSGLAIPKFKKMKVK